MSTNSNLQLFSDTNDWALLSVADLTFVINQNGISDIRHISDASDYEGVSGILVSKTNPENISIAINTDLKALNHLPESRFIATEIKHSDSQHISWCWDKVVLINQTQFSFFSLPEVTQRQDSPIRYAMNYQNKLVYYVDMDQLLQFTAFNPEEDAAPNKSNDALTIQDNQTTEVAASMTQPF